MMTSVENVTLGLRPRVTFSTSGSSYLDVELSTVHHLYTVTPPPVGVAEYCDEHVCFCLCVRLSSSISSELHVWFLLSFLHVTYGHGSVVVWQHCYVMHSYALLQLSKCFNIAHVLLLVEMRSLNEARIRFLTKNKVVTFWDKREYSWQHWSHDSWYSYIHRGLLKGKR